MKKIQKAALAVATIGIAAAPVAISTTTAPAQASGIHRVVFKAWGNRPVARVDIDGRHDITRQRVLPFSQTQYLSGIDLQFASIEVEVPGFSTVGCSIKINGRLVARDVGPGAAYCSNL